MNNLSPELEDTRSVAQTLIEGVATSEDPQIIRRVGDLVSRTELLRTNDRSNTEKVLKILSRKLEHTQKKNHDYRLKINELEQADKNDHLDQMSSSLKENINIMNETIEQCRKEINLLDEELSYITVQESSLESETISDSQLKLYIYRNLGVEMLKDDQSHEYNKCRVFSSSKNDIEYMDFNNDVPDYQYSNRIWDLCM